MYAAKISKVGWDLQLIENEAKIPLNYIQFLIDGNLASLWIAMQISAHYSPIW